MLERAKEVIDRIAERTDEVLLMHSLAGKDSIALLDLLYPRFRRVVCCFMYTVPNLAHIAPYYAYARRRYPNAEWVQTPHYTVYNYRKYGFMGMQGDGRQRLWKLSDIIDKVRQAKQVEWCCLGFKQSDSLNRRLMLRSYKGDDLEAVSEKGKKFYPLSTYKNRDINDYITQQHLKAPLAWGNQQSNGFDLHDKAFLAWLKHHYPQDLQRIAVTYPAVTLLAQ